MLLLDKNIDVLMSDTDAIWLRNPFPSIQHFFSRSDLISSRASFPEEIARKLGATLCMGFIYIKATNSTRVLWREFYFHMVKTKKPDDQRDFNLLLSNLYQLKYEIPQPFMAVNEIASTDPSKAVVGSARKPTENDDFMVNYGTARVLNSFVINVTLLPHYSFRRNCHASINSKNSFHISNSSNSRNRMSQIHQYEMSLLTESIIAHCLAFKKTLDSKNGKKSFGLWAIRNNWKSASPKNCSVDNYLEGIIEKSLFVS
jgi:hypothetical protein